MVEPVWFIIEIQTMLDCVTTGTYSGGRHGCFVFQTHCSNATYSVTIPESSISQTGLEWIPRQILLGFAVLLAFPRHGNPEKPTSEYSSTTPLTLFSLAL